jgi:O-antigen biosynthesis protein
LQHCQAAGRDEYLLSLNNDFQVTQGWLDSIPSVLRERQDAGAVGSMLLYPDRRLQEAGGIIRCDSSD